MGFHTLVGEKRAGIVSEVVDQIARERGLDGCFGARFAGLGLQYVDEMALVVEEPVPQLP